jgi:hypothetical protein
MMRRYDRSGFASLQPSRPRNCPLRDRMYPSSSTATMQTTSLTSRGEPQFIRIEASFGLRPASRFMPAEEHVGQMQEWGPGCRRAKPIAWTVLCDLLGHRRPHARCRGCRRPWNSHFDPCADARRQPPTGDSPLTESVDWSCNVAIRREPGRNPAGICHITASKQFPTTRLKLNRLPAPSKTSRH